MDLKKKNLTKAQGGLYRTLCLALSFANLCKAPHIEAKEVKASFYPLIAKKELFVITIHGKPKMVAVPYLEFLNLLEKVSQ